MWGWTQNVKSRPWTWCISRSLSFSPCHELANKHVRCDYLIHADFNWWGNTWAWINGTTSHNTANGQYLTRPEHNYFSRVWMKECIGTAIKTCQCKCYTRHVTQSTSKASWIPPYRLSQGHSVLVWLHKKNLHMTCLQLLKPCAATKPCVHH